MNEFVVRFGEQMSRRVDALGRLGDSFPLPDTGLRRYESSRLLPPHAATGPSLRPIRLRRGGFANPLSDRTDNR